MPAQQAQQLVVEVNPILQYLVGTAIVAVIGFIAKQTLTSFKFNPEDLKASIDGVKADVAKVDSNLHQVREELGREMARGFNEVGKELTAARERIAALEGARHL